MVQNQAIKRAQTQSIGRVIKNQTTKPTIQPINQTANDQQKNVSRVNEVFTTKSELSLPQPNARKTTAVTTIFQQLEISN